MHGRVHGLLLLMLPVPVHSIETRCSSSGDSACTTPLGRVQAPATAADFADDSEAIPGDRHAASVHAATRNDPTAPAQRSVDSLGCVSMLPSSVMNLLRAHGLPGTKLGADCLAA